MIEKYRNLEIFDNKPRLENLLGWAAPFYNDPDELLESGKVRLNINCIKRNIVC
jgi:hypothetical protein